MQLALNFRQSVNRASCGLWLCSVAKLTKAVLKLAMQSMPAGQTNSWYIDYSEVIFLPHKDNTIFGIEDSSMPDFALIGAQVGYGTPVLSIMLFNGRVRGISVAIRPFEFGNYFDTVG